MTTSTFQRRGFWQAALSAAFVCMIAGPNLDLVFGIDKNPSPMRVSVPFPKLELGASLRHFPGAVLYYLKSNMGFRPTLVRLHAWLKLLALNISPSPTSVIPQLPWLFMKSERVLDDFRRVEPFTQAELERWERALQAHDAALAQQGIHYLLVLVPNKETVYAESMPAYATRAPGPSRLTQLVDRLQTHSHLAVLDLRETLLAHKAKARLYHYTDTHWNDSGAFLGYQAIMAKLQPWFPSLRALHWPEMQRRHVLTEGGDLARICGVRRDLLEPQTILGVPTSRAHATLEDGSPLQWTRTDVTGVPRFVTTAADGEISKLVFARDSFADLLIPFLSQHFRRALWTWTYDFPAADIAKQKPVLVIQELAERKLMVLQPP